MARKKKVNKDIEQYDHADKKRLNNPPVGLVSENTEPYSTSKNTYKYDPHLDPQLQWAGKAEHTSFEVPTRSLHVHERIDPKTIIDTLKKEKTGPVQISLFESEKRPLREAIEFYKHKGGWSNRLIAGDSLLVMNSLLEKEGMAGKVQMVYIGPPYGIKYGSNFQPFVNKRDVTGRKEEDLTAEPEMIKAFRDTWGLGIHSYLTYLRDRLLLARELLHESGSIFVQISDENVHHVKEILDEIFGVHNFMSLITFQKTGGFSPKFLLNVCDYLIWYSKNKEKSKYNPIYKDRISEGSIPSGYLIEINNEIRSTTKEERVNPFLIPNDAKLFQSVSLESGGWSEIGSKPFKFKGKCYTPRSNAHWKTTHDGLNRLAKANRILQQGNIIRYKMYFDDFPVIGLSNIWKDLMGATDMHYVVETNVKVIERCLLMTTDI